MNSTGIYTRKITDIVLEDIKNCKIKYLKPVKLRIPISMQKMIFHESGCSSSFKRLKCMFGVPVVMSKKYEIVVEGRW